MILIMKKILFISLLIVSLVFAGCEPNNDVASSDGESTDNGNISSQSYPNVSSGEESSFTEDISIDVSALCKQADILAEHIAVYSLFVYNLPDDNSLLTELSDVEIFRYIASTFIFADIENHPYNDIAKDSIVRNEGNAIYMLESTQKMVHQLFGKENFLAQGSEFDNAYDESTEIYTIPTEAGFGNNLIVENVVSMQNDDTIETQIKLVKGHIGENVSQEYGTIKIVFKIINERNDVFLRFKEMSLL